MVFGRKLVGKLDYLQNFNDYLLKCSVGKLLISCSGNSYQNQGQGWRNNQHNQNNQGYGWQNNQNNGPSTRTNEPPPEKKLDLEQALAQMLTSHSAFMNETKANMQQQATQLNNQAAQLRSLEAQMGQMANLLTERQPGSLPSNSEVNPRKDGNEHVKAVR